MGAVFLFFNLENSKETTNFAVGFPLGLVDESDVSREYFKCATNNHIFCY